MRKPLPCIRGDNFAPAPIFPNCFIGVRPQEAARQSVVQDLLMLPPIRSDVCMTVPVVSFFSTPLEAAATNAAPSAGSTAGSGAVFETLVSAFFQAAENATPRTELPPAVEAGAPNVEVSAPNQPVLPQEARGVTAPASGADPASNTRQNDNSDAALPLFDASAPTDLAQGSAGERKRKREFPPNSCASLRSLAPSRSSSRISTGC